MHLFIRIRIKGTEARRQVNQVHSVVPDLLLPSSPLVIPLPNLNLAALLPLR